MRFQLAATTGMVLCLGLGLAQAETAAPIRAPNAPPPASPSGSGPVILPLQDGARQPGPATGAVETPPDTRPVVTDPTKPASEGTAPKGDGPDEADDDADEAGPAADVHGHGPQPTPMVTTGGPLGCVAEFAELDRDGDGFLSRAEAPEVTVSVRIDPVTLQELGVAREDYLRSCALALDASDPLLSAPSPAAPSGNGGAPAASPKAVP